jgi:hypothetical protein
MTGRLDDEWELNLETNTMRRTSFKGGDTQQYLSLKGSTLPQMEYEMSRSEFESRHNGEIDHFSFLQMYTPTTTNGMNTQLGSVGGDVLSATSFSAQCMLIHVGNNFNLLQKESELLELGLNYSDELSKVNTLGTAFRRLGVAGSFLGLGLSLYSFSEAQTFEGKAEHGLDVMVSAVGFMGLPGAAFSLYWNFGGKRLHQQWEQKVLMPQLEMNVPAHTIFSTK